MLLVLKLTVYSNFTGPKCRVSIIDKTMELFLKNLPAHLFPLFVVVALLSNPPKASSSKTMEFET